MYKPSMYILGIGGTVVHTIYIHAFNTFHVSNVQTKYVYTWYRRYTVPGTVIHTIYIHAFNTFHVSNVQTEGID